MSEMEIDGLQGLLPKMPGLGAPETDNGPGESSFSKIIGEMLSDANKAINNAEKSAADFAEGKGDPIETVLALNRADMSLKFVVQLRNKFVEAYREISRLGR